MAPRNYAGASGQFSLRSPLLPCIRETHLAHRSVCVHVSHQSSQCRQCDGLACHPSPSAVRPARFPFRVLSSISNTLRCSTTPLTCLCRTLLYYRPLLSACCRVIGCRCPVTSGDTKIIQFVTTNIKLNGNWRTLSSHSHPFIHWYEAQAALNHISAQPAGFNYLHIHTLMTQCWR